MVLNLKNPTVKRVNSEIKMRNASLKSPSKSPSSSPLIAVTDNDKITQTALTTAKPNKIISSGGSSSLFSNNINSWNSRFVTNALFQRNKNIWNMSSSPDVPSTDQFARLKEQINLANLQDQLNKASLKADADSVQHWWDLFKPNERSILDAQALQRMQDTITAAEMRIEALNQAGVNTDAAVAALANQSRNQVTNQGAAGETFTQQTSSLFGDTGKLLLIAGGVLVVLMLVKNK